MSDLRAFPARGMQGKEDTEEEEAAMEARGQGEGGREGGGRGAFFAIGQGGFRV